MEAYGRTGAPGAPLTEGEARAWCDPYPRPPVPLTREIVLSAALDIIDRDGADGLTMRRLGQCTRTRSDGSVPLRGEQERPARRCRGTGDGAGRDWTPPIPTGPANCARSPATSAPSRSPIRTSCRCSSPVRSRRRWHCARSAPCARSRTPSTLLTRAGFSDVEALHVYRSFQGLLFGHVLNELQELVDNPEETDDLLRLGLHRLPIAEFPLLRGLASALTSYDGAAELEEGLDILIDGLRSKGHVTG